MVAHYPLNMSLLAAVGGQLTSMTALHEARPKKDAVWYPNPVPCSPSPLLSPEKGERSRWIHTLQLALGIHFLLYTDLSSPPRYVLT